MLLIITSSDDISLSFIEDDLELSSKIKILYYDTFLLDGFIDLKLLNSETSISFEINNKIYQLNDFKKVWYKQFSFNQEPDNSINSVELFRDFYKNELKSLHYYFHYKIFKTLETINSPFKGISNKLVQLDVFIENGFKIPETKIITRNFEINLVDKKYITKGISIPPQIEIEKKMHVGYTSEITESDKSFFTTDKMFPTLIQEKVEIKSELRVFYFLNYIFAINIDVNRENFVDYRSTNYSNEFYKSYPVELSEELKNRIRIIMNKLDLDSGSLDILISNEDQCIFLEVNKYGQFGMINDLSPNYMLKKVLNIILNKN